MASGRWIYTMVAMLATVTGALGHMDKNSSHDQGKEEEEEEESSSYPPTYLSLDSHRAAIRLHIGLMILAWFIILPIGMY